VALFRDNVGKSNYNAATAKLERRFSHGLTVNAAYTFSKLMDEASSVFSQTIFTGPVLNGTGAADAYNRRLERDVSSGEYRVSSRWAGSTTFRGCGRSRVGRSRAWFACRPVTPWP